LSVSFAIDENGTALAGNRPLAAIPLIASARPTSVPLEALE